MPFPSLRSRLRKLSYSSLIALAILLIPGHVLASTYGSGGYNNCTYNQGCSSSSSAPTASPAPTTTTSPVVLNDFSEYFTDSGKQLDLGAGQTVYVDLTTNGTTVQNSITLSTVGDTYVDLSFSQASINDRLNIGQTKEYDLNGDGKNDIKITLNSISNGKANLTFGVVLGASTTTQPHETPSAPAVHKSRSWTGVILSIIAIVAALAIFFMLWWRRRKKDQQPGPWTAS